MKIYMFDGSAGLRREIIWLAWLGCHLYMSYDLIMIQSTGEEYDGWHTSIMDMTARKNGNGGSSCFVILSLAHEAIFQIFLSKDGRKISLPEYSLEECRLSVMTGSSFYSMRHDNVALWASKYKRSWRVVCRYSVGIEFITTRPEKMYLVVLWRK